MRCTVQGRNPFAAANSRCIEAPWCARASCGASGSGLCPWPFFPVGVRLNDCTDRANTLFFFSSNIFLRVRVKKNPPDTNHEPRSIQESVGWIRSLLLWISESLQRPSHSPVSGSPSARKYQYFHVHLLFTPRHLFHWLLLPFGLV